MRRALAVAAGLIAGFSANFAHSGERAADEAVRAYLAEKLGPPDRCEELQGPAQIDIAWADLNGDGRPEALVYVSGRGWCGSGGCGLMILERTPSGFRERGDVSISRPPVAVLPTRSHGWRDVSVFVSGGGILPGYSAALPFDGERYAGNPSVPPARPLGPGVKVRNLFASGQAARGLILFPKSVEPLPPADLPDGSVAVNGRAVEVSVPSDYQSCWNWVNLTPPGASGPLRYVTGKLRRDSTGRTWNVWVFDATGPGEANLDFALIPGWKFIYLREAQRAAAARIWTAKIVVP